MQVRTAEHDLLRLLAEYVEYPVNQLNDLAVKKAMADGYIDSHGDTVWITSDGIDRLDDLED